MKTRCLNTASKGFENYGKRGIQICDRWLKFENFLEDMGDPPPGMTLDRVDVNGNYEPGNCRWASRGRQCRNQRRNRMETYKGETMCLADWSERLRIPYGVLMSRLCRGAKFEEAVEQGWASDHADERRIKAALEAVKGISTRQLGIVANYENDEARLSWLGWAADQASRGRGLPDQADSPAPSRLAAQGRHPSNSPFAMQKS